MRIARICKEFTDQARIWALGVLAAPVTRPQTFGPAHTTIFRAPVAAFTPTNLILTPTLPRPKYTVLATAPGIEGKPFGEEPSFDAPELSVDLSPSTDGDGSASKTGLIIAVSIISVFLVITTSICVYLAKKIRDQRIYYEAQLAAAIRDGQLDDRAENVTSYLRSLADQRLNVSHPGYQNE